MEKKESKKMKYAVEVKDLSFSYDGNKSVVDHVSFSIQSGKYVTLIGHNGSGKSTLAKLLIGLLASSSGEVKLLGESLNQENIARLRRKAGIVFQNPDNQFIGATVRDDLAFGLENRCVPHEDMENLILTFAKKVNMEEFLDKEPNSLSGGQKQRVAIAGVLAMNPEIVIFDEATAMLDPKGKKEIHEIIKKMREETPSLTVISITHDIEEAFLSDEIIVLNEGKIYLQGSPKEVFSKEKELKSIKLDLPFLLKMKKALYAEGIDVGDVQNIDDLVNKLCQ